MLKRIYTEIPIIYRDCEFLYKAADFSCDKIPFSAYAVSKNDIKHKVGFIEVINGLYVSGRHIYLDNICFKGVGYSEFTDISKERKILGGVCSDTAIKEFVITNILKINETTNQNILGLGHLCDNSNHYFLIRDWNVMRFGFAYEQKDSERFIMFLAKKFQSYNVYDIISNAINKFYFLLENGVLHSSINRFNLDILGEFLDLESIYLAKSNERISIPITFEVDTFDHHNFSLENDKVYIDYIKDFLNIVEFSLLPFWNHVLNEKKQMYEFMDIIPTYKYSEKLVVIQKKKIYDKKIVYTEMILEKLQRRSFIGKKLLKSIQSPSFREILLTKLKLNNNYVEDLFSNLKKKASIIKSLSELFINDSNVERLRLAGSLVEENSVFYDDSDIDICLKVKKDRLRYRLILKNLFKYPIDIVFFENLNKKKHLKWHLDFAGASIKGNWRIKKDTLKYSELAFENINRYEHILKSIRRNKNLKEFTPPDESNVFLGYLVPLEQEAYSLRYIYTLVSYYSFLKLFSDNKLCSFYFVKNELLKNYLKLCKDDTFHSIVQNIYTFVSKNGRIISIKENKDHFKELLKITEKIYDIEKEVLRLGDNKDLALN